MPSDLFEKKLKVFLFFVWYSRFLCRTLKHTNKQRENEQGKKNNRYKSYSSNNKAIIKRVG